jgi:hypothetical protein
MLAAKLNNRQFYSRAETKVNPMSVNLCDINYRSISLTCFFSYAMLVPGDFVRTVSNALRGMNLNARRPLHFALS